MCASACVTFYDYDYDYCKIYIGLNLIKLNKVDECLPPVVNLGVGAKCYFGMMKCVREGP